jgi:YD repeat-containing protein
VFYVSTDQDGNFRVGEYFRIDQATGRATLNANAFDLAGLTSLRLGSIGAQLGETINEFSSDATMSGNSNVAVPTEYAVRTYVSTGLNSSQLTQPLLANGITRDASGRVTASTNGFKTISNVVYNANNQITSYTESVNFGSGASTRNVTVTYTAAGLVNTVSSTVV